MKIGAISSNYSTGYRGIPYALEQEIFWGIRELSEAIRESAEPIRDRSVKAGLAPEGLLSLRVMQYQPHSRRTSWNALPHLTFWQRKAWNIWSKWLSGMGISSVGERLPRSDRTVEAAAKIIGGSVRASRD